MACIDGYYDPSLVQYHNALHALDTYQMFVRAFGRSALSKDEKVGVALALLCHDYGHPGGDWGFGINDKLLKEIQDNFLTNDRKLDEGKLNSTESAVTTRTGRLAKLLLDNTLNWKKDAFFAPEYKYQDALLEQYSAVHARRLLKESAPASATKDKGVLDRPLAFYGAAVNSNILGTDFATLKSKSQTLLAERVASTASLTQKEALTETEEKELTKMEEDIAALSKAQDGWLQPGLERLIGTQTSASLVPKSNFRSDYERGKAEKSWTLSQLVTHACDISHPVGVNPACWRGRYLAEAGMPLANADGSWSGPVSVPKVTWSSEGNTF